MLEHLCPIVRTICLYCSKKFSACKFVSMQTILMLRNKNRMSIFYLHTPHVPNFIIQIFCVLQKYVQTSNGCVSQAMHQNQKSFKQSPHFPKYFSFYIVLFTCTPKNCEICMTAVLNTKIFQSKSKE